MIAPAFSSCGCGEVHVGRIQSHVTWSELFSHRWRVCPSDKLIHAKHCFKYSFILGGVRIIIIWMVVSNIFYVHPYLGKIPILTNIFQVLWNHLSVMFETTFLKHLGHFLLNPPNCHIAITLETGPHLYDSIHPSMARIAKVGCHRTAWSAQHR